eukprot:324217_1
MFCSYCEVVTLLVIRGIFSGASMTYCAARHICHLTFFFKLGANFNPLAVGQLKSDQEEKIAPVALTVQDTPKPEWEEVDDKQKQIDHEPAKGEGAVFETKLTVDSRQG